MRFHLTYIVILAVFIGSCGKEVSVEKKVTQPPVDSSGNGDGTLLVREVIYNEGSSDSSINILSYDDQKRLISVTNCLEGFGNASYAEGDEIYTRNSAGMIEKIVDFARFYENGSLQSKDTVTCVLHNDGSKYTYGIRTSRKSSGEIVNDSLLYTYNNNGQINMFQSLRPDVSGIYFETQRTTYVYDNKGNITTMTIRFVDNGNDPPQVISLTYDDKVAALNIGSEALLNGFGTGLGSPSNIIKVEDLSADAPQLTTYSYTYNSYNKPVAAVMTDQIENKKANIVYYYK